MGSGGRRRRRWERDKEREKQIKAHSPPGPPPYCAAFTQLTSAAVTDPAPRPPAPFVCAGPVGRISFIALLHFQCEFQTPIGWERCAQEWQLCLLDSPWQQQLLRWKRCGRIGRNGYCCASSRRAFETRNDGSNVWLQFLVTDLISTRSFKFYKF